MIIRVLLSYLLVGNDSKNLLVEKSDKIVDCDSNSMDYTVLIDSVLLALTDPCKEVCQTSLMALKLICETTVALLGSINKVIYSSETFTKAILK